MSVVVHIDFPIWKVPRRVGIRPDRITDDLVVYINYWKNNGELEYRNPRFIKLADAKRYPTEYFTKKKGKGKILLRLIPIESMQELKI